MEFGEKVHYRKNPKGHKDNKLDGKWGEGYFLGFYWKTSEALVGTPEGVNRAGTIRRIVPALFPPSGVPTSASDVFQWKPKK